MSSLLGLTPTMRVVLRNPLQKKEYPLAGHLVAVVDTGYEGFVALPRDVFSSLFMGLQVHKRMVMLANGTMVSSEGTYGAFRAEGIALEADGFVETYEGLDEVLLGVEALSHSSVLLDYCNRRVEVETRP